MSYLLCYLNFPKQATNRRCLSLQESPAAILIWDFSAAYSCSNQRLSITFLIWKLGKTNLSLGEKVWGFRRREWLGVVMRGVKLCGTDYAVKSMRDAKEERLPKRKW